MPRNGSGVYSLPSNYLATTGETITALQHNSPLADLASDANQTRPVVAGGTGKSTLTSGRVLVGNGSSAIQDSKAAPTGEFVGTTDTQTLTNKTLTSPTLNTPTFSTGAIPTAALADSAVTTAKIADEAVTTAKIDDDAVTLAKQASGTANRLQGFDGSGNPSEVTVSGATLSGGTLTVTPPTDYQLFTGSGTWTKPSGTTASSRVFVQAWGAGGGGNTNSSGSNNGGGGGGAYRERWFLASELSSTVAVTVGAGGAKGNPASDGGQSSFGSHVVAPPGIGGTSSFGGSGGSGFTFWAGGTGGYAVSPAGSVALGGGGGGGEDTNTSGGTSFAGGDGGDAGSNGSAPGGGGGWNANGARGEVRVTTFV